MNVNRYKVLFFVISAFFLLSSCPIPYPADYDFAYDGATEDTRPDSEIIVYITETGSKYHRGSCGYLWSSSIAITLEEAKEQNYSPCSRCDPQRYLLIE